MHILVITANLQIFCIPNVKQIKSKLGVYLGTKRLFSSPKKITRTKQPWSALRVDSKIPHLQ